MLFFPLSSGVLIPSSTVKSEQIWTSWKHLVCWCCQLQRKISLLVAITCNVCFWFPFEMFLHYLLCLSLNWHCLFHAMHKYLMRVFLRGWFLLKYFKVSVRNEVPGIGIIHAVIPSSHPFNSLLHHLLSVCLKSFIIFSYLLNEIFPLEPCHTGMIMSGWINIWFKAGWLVFLYIDYILNNV